MGTALAPSHLLSLDKSLTQNLVDGRLNEGRGNGFPMPVTVTVVGNTGSICADVGPEFSNRFSATFVALGYSFRGPEQLPGLSQFVALCEHFHARDSI